MSRHAPECNVNWKPGNSRAHESSLIETEIIIIIIIKNYIFYIYITLYFVNLLFTM